jgi:hypothetical protein
MKLLAVFLVLLPFSMALTHKECRAACQTDYGTGGRVATSLDKGPDGFNNNDIDCTCVFTWFSVRNDAECQTYCNNQRRYSSKYCHTGSNMCVLHAGLIY